MTNRSKKVMHDMIVAMRSAGIRPGIIYAYEKTGLLVDEAGYMSLSPKDKAAYDEAFDEYEAKHGN
jgi:TRAP-type C4-dicarboxylate transport system substrate-binding protein